MAFHYKYNLTMIESLNQMTNFNNSIDKKKTINKLTKVRYQVTITRQILNFNMYKPLHWNRFIKIYTHTQKRNILFDSSLFQVTSNLFIFVILAIILS